MLHSKMRKNELGAASVEFALAIPLVLLLFYGIAQYGLILLANSGVRHAVDTAARATTVYIGATPMTDAQIRSRVTASLYGVEIGSVSPASVVRGSSNGVSYVDITLTYSAPVDLIFYKFGPITLSEKRRAYLP